MLFSAVISNCVIECGGTKTEVRRRTRLDQCVSVRAASEERLLRTPVVSSNMVNWRPGAAAEVLQRQSSGSDRRTDRLNCHSKTNYRHTLLSTQRDFYAHPKASSCLCLCTYHLSYSFSIPLFCFSCSYSLWRADRKRFFFYYLTFLLPSPPSSALPLFFHISPFLHQALFSFSPPLFSTSLPPFSLWAATPRGDICWLAAPL